MQRMRRNSTCFTNLTNSLGHIKSGNYCVSKLLTIVNSLLEFGTRFRMQSPNYLKEHYK